MTKRFKFLNNLTAFANSALIFLIPGVAFGQITNISQVTSTPVPGAGHDYKMLTD